MGQTVIVRQVNGANVEEPVGLPPMAAHANEGKTIAGWTLMWLVGIGALIVAIGMPMGSTPLMIAGIAVAIIGLAASAILRAMGHGQPRTARAPAETP